MKKTLLIILYIFSSQFGFSQSHQEIYEQAFQEIKCMLNKTCTASFKDAVFTTENAYLSNQLDRNQFESQISFLTTLSKGFIASRDLIYTYNDKAEVKKYAALFSIITDTIPVQIDSTNIVHLLPYTYDFDDIWGHKDWSNMFVTKLLDTKKGNCHSLPYLYKIIADEIDAKAHIAVAPNHFYIKHQNQANGWYNTELTSAIFPIDAWLMASGYIHLDAIVNKLYMEALNNQQMIALCMIDLAKGYERKLGVLAQSEYILKCCNAALVVYPHYINALLLKAETQKKAFEQLMVKNNAVYPVDVLNMPEAQRLFSEMSMLYSKIHELGYRKMPEKMYLNWLVSLKKERNLYENKEISNFKSQAH